MNSIATHESMIPVNFEYFVLNEEGGFAVGVGDPISREPGLGVRVVTLIFRGDLPNPL